MQENTERGAGASGVDELSLVGLLLTLARYRKRIVVVPLLAAIAAAIISLLLPPSYRAGARLLPPQSAQSSAGMLLSQLGSSAGIAGAFAGLKNPADLYIDMLRSRTVADRMVAKFELQKHYATPSLEIARQDLADRTAISTGKGGLIVVEVEDQDQQLVARLANGYVDELMRLTRVLAVTEASQRRLFFERQLTQAKDSLAEAETRLKSGLDAHGVISVDTESAAIVETVARLRAQVSAKEIELNAMRAFVTEGHPDYQRASEALSSLRGELAKLENGRAITQATAAANGKSGGLENIQLVRDLKYYQMLYELLAKQYEVARLDEARDPAIVQVLDSAVAPERRFKPKRTLIVLSATLAAFVLTVFSAFFSESRRRAMTNAELAAQWGELKQLLRFR